MPHVLVAGKLHPAGLALLEATPGMTFTHVEEISEASYQPYLAEADAVLIRTQPMSAASIAMAPRLQIVSRHGVGYDAVDVAALNARKIPLCIVGDVNSVSVAEHAMMLILAGVKRLIRSDSAVRQGQWGWRNALEQGEVAGKTLLIIGYGRIGRHLARMAAAFDMTVIAHDPWALTHGWPEGAATPVTTLAEGLARADVISVNLPKAERPILGAEELAITKQGAILINTARGGIIDETALAQALTSGQIAAAALDVFDTEPPNPQNQLLKSKQTILTPHIAGLTQQAAIRMAIAAAQNIINHFNKNMNQELIVNRDFC